MLNILISYTVRPKKGLVINFENIPKVRISTKISLQSREVSVIFLQLHYCCFWLTLRPSSLALTLHAVVWHHSTIAVVGVAQRPKSFLAYVSRPWTVCQICSHFQSLFCVTHFETSWELQGHLWRQRIQEEEEHDSAGITGFVYYLTVCNSCFSRCFCLDMYFDAIWLSWILQIEQITTQRYK